MMISGSTDLLVGSCFSAIAQQTYGTDYGIIVTVTGDFERVVCLFLHFPKPEPQVL